MLNKLGALTLLLGLSILAHGQEATESSGFTLDPSKPYAYLQFDRIGPRDPLTAGEPARGLWLKIVNNCRLPIQIRTSGPQVLDEIAHVREGRDQVIGQAVILGARDGGVQIEAESGEVPTFSSPIPTRLPGSGASTSATGANPTPPEGYRDRIRLYRVLTIPSGEYFYFSVPRNHVSPNWYLRVEFTLVIGASNVSQPSSYLDFFESQIPSADRAIP